MKVVSISKSFGLKAVLKDCSLEVPTGNIQALLGRNGAGKSTLINIMADIIPADSGYVEIANTVVSPAQYGYKQHVGYLIEENLLINNLSAIEYLKLMGAFYNLSKKKLDKQIEYLIAYFELPEDRTLIRKFSKGMKAKLNLASTLIHEPKILVLDEPFNGLDFPSVQKLSKLLKKIALNGGEILIASHQFALIAEICDRFALIEGGKNGF
jgi:ABC-2 type transport system ATP-binding protein